MASQELALDVSVDVHRQAGDEEARVSASRAVRPERSQLLRPGPVPRKGKDFLAAVVPSTSPKPAAYPATHTGSKVPLPSGPTGNALRGTAQQRNRGQRAIGTKVRKWPRVRPPQAIPLRATSINSSGSFGPYSQTGHPASSNENDTLLPAHHRPTKSLPNPHANTIVLNEYSSSRKGTAQSAVNVAEQSSRPLMRPARLFEGRRRSILIER